MILSPTEENHIVYKTTRNKITQMIRTEKKQANFDARGQNPSPRKVYATLKSKKRLSEMSKFARMRVQSMQISPRLDLFSLRK